MGFFAEGTLWPARCSLRCPSDLARSSAPRDVAKRNRTACFIAASTALDVASSGPPRCAAKIPARPSSRAEMGGNRYVRLPDLCRDPPVARSGPAPICAQRPLPGCGHGPLYGGNGRKAEWLLSVVSHHCGGLGDAGMRFSKCATINDLRVRWSSEPVEPVALGSSWLPQVERQPSQHWRKSRDNRPRCRAPMKSIA